MYCSYCGAEILDDAKFCYKCGKCNVMNAGIESNESRNALRELSERIGLKEKKEKIEKTEIIEPIDDVYVKEFIVFGEKIGFSERDLQNIEILHRLIEKAAEGRNELLEYQAEISRVDQLDNLEKEVNSQFSKLITEIKRIITDYQFEDIFFDVFDPYEYFKKITVISCIDSVRERIKKELLEAENAKKEAIEYNRMRKESRARVIGGGFGLKGAVKGMAMASALNATSGVAYSVKNAFSSVSINSQYHTLVNRIQNSSYIDIADTFYQDCLKIIESFLGKLSKCGCFMKYTFEKKKEADKLLRQLCCLDTERFDKIPQLFIKILNLYPIEEEYYVKVCCRLGNPDGEIIKLAQGLGIDTIEINKAIASREYQRELIGDRIQEIQALGKSGVVVEKFQFFTDYEINHWLEVDCDNTLQVFCANLKYALYSGASSFYTFEYGKNLNLLRNVEKIDFTWQEPIILLWRAGLSEECLYESSNKYLLLTTEKLYTNKLTLPIMEIFNIRYDNWKIIINGNFYIDYFDNDDSIQKVLFTAILYLQLLHQQGKEKKIIPLLERKYVKYEETNIYEKVKTTILNTDLQIQERLQEDINHKRLFFGNFLEEDKEKFFDRVLQLSDNEFIIVCWWDSSCSDGFAITNRRLIYSHDHSKNGKYLYVYLEDYKEENFQDSYTYFNILGNRVDITRKEKYNQYFAWICRRIIYELTNSKDVLKPKDIKYDMRQNAVILEKEYDQLKNNKNYDEILKKVFVALAVGGGIIYGVHLDGMKLSEKDKIRLSSFDLKDGEKIYWEDGLPLLAKPAKSGKLITSRGIHDMTSTSREFMSWNDFPFASILWNYHCEIIIDGKVSLFSLKDAQLGKFIVEMANILGAEVLIQSSDGRYRNKGEVIDDVNSFYIRVKEDKKKELSDSSCKVHEDDDIVEKNESKEGVNEKVQKIKPIFCPFCGKLIARNVKFCNFCGKANKYGNQQTER